MVPYMQFDLIFFLTYHCLIIYLTHPSWNWWNNVSRSALGRCLCEFGGCLVQGSGIGARWRYSRHQFDKKGHINPFKHSYINPLFLNHEELRIQQSNVAGLFPGCGCSTGVTTWLCHVSLDLQGESDGRTWHMKVHTNRRTNIGSNKHFNPIFLPGLLLEAYVEGSTLISFECSSVSGTFPKVVTQACLRCLHIRGHLPCSNPIFFSKWLLLVGVFRSCVMFQVNKSTRIVRHVNSRFGAMLF